MQPYESSSRPVQRQPPRLLLISLLVVLLLLLGVTWWFNRLGKGNKPLLDPNAQPRTVTPRGDLGEAEKSTIELFRQASPSVVFVTSTAVGQDLNFNEMEIPRGSGTGFIWDKKGHIVTNFHVVEGADRWRVKLGDKRWDAQIVGAVPDRDIAVLKIDAPEEQLQPILIGESNNLQVGQHVFAIGNPFGLGQTLTTGVISGLGREIKARTGRTIQGVIQTDAAINPGNSGGPLLDSAGRLIGVNTAIYSPSGASAGIGFAIPVDSVNRAVPMILRRGLVVRPVLGVQVGPDQIVRNMGLEGVMVLQLPQGSPAAAAGMLAVRRDPQGNELPGDIIIAINGKKVTELEDLLSTLLDYKPGDTVKVTVIRNAKTPQQENVELDVTLIKPQS